MDKNTGGPAFPRPYSEQRYEKLIPPGVHQIEAQDGMSLCDFFAAAALQGILASVQPDEVGTPGIVAKAAYAYADAMLQEREGGGGGKIMTTKIYLEHERLKEVKDKTQAIHDFIEWLGDEKGVFLAKEYWGETLSLRESFDSLLAEFFGIDLRKLEAEKREMLDEIRRTE